MAHTIPAARREDEIRIASDVWWQIHFAFAQVVTRSEAPSKLSLAPDLSNHRFSALHQQLLSWVRIPWNIPLAPSTALSQEPVVTLFLEESYLEILGSNEGVPLLDAEGDSVSECFPTRFDFPMEEDEPGCVGSSPTFTPVSRNL
ncbi:hypothetical protein CK203_095614 [Vitis vinifera]|uniref:Uncharacterized protein n=1 Tax=Vitis vinifera TaxID=29760 RepID=A0A438FGU3_VITVI|nr:hypothetical protein CK203_095614 [Vitis vinifera]